jgi:hypothetical protein
MLPPDSNFYPMIIKAMSNVQAGGLPDSVVGQ